MLRLAQVVFLASIVLATEGSHCCSRIAVGYSKAPYGFSNSMSEWFRPAQVAKTHQIQIFGYYERTDDEEHGRPVYRSERYDGQDAIWFCGDQWYVGQNEHVGRCEGYANAGWKNRQSCVDHIEDNDWQVYNGIEFALDRNLKVRCA